MAFTVSQLMTDIRRKIIMPKTDDLDDAELLVYVNQMNRELYREAAKYCPNAVWVDDDTGNTVASEALLSAQDDTAVMHWIMVKVNNRRLIKTHPRDVYSLSRTGEPTQFWQSGFKSVRLYPIPDGVYPYELLYVPEPAVLTGESTMIWPNDFYDLLLDGVSMIAKVRNGWDPRGEAELMQEWRGQAIIRLSSLAYDDIDNAVNGYWDISFSIAREDY